MKIIFWILLFAMIHFIGCSATNTYLIKHDQMTYDMLNRKLLEERGKMILKNGAIIKSGEIHIGIDSTFWKESAEPRHIKVSLTEGSEKTSQEDFLTKTIVNSEIEGFSFINRGKGCSAGAGTGFLLGAGLGTVAGLAVKKGGEEGRGSALIIPAVGAGGALFGLIIGAIIGGKDKYIFTDSTAGTQ